MSERIGPGPDDQSAEEFKTQPSNELHGVALPPIEFTRPENNPLDDLHPLPPDEAALMSSEEILNYINTHILITHNEFINILGALDLGKQKTVIDGILNCPPEDEFGNTSPLEGFQAVIARTIYAYPSETAREVFDILIEKRPSLIAANFSIYKYFVDDQIEFAMIVLHREAGNVVMTHLEEFSAEYREQIVANYILEGRGDLFSRIVNPQNLNLTKIRDLCCEKLGKAEGSLVFELTVNPDSIYYDLKHNKIRDLIDLTLAKYKLNGHVYQEWIDSYSAAYNNQTVEGKEYNRIRDFLPYLIDNLNRMRDLEETYPGSVNTLYTQFGIVNFARYHIITLMNLYRQREQADRDYGLLIMPKADWNNAFAQIPEVILQLQRDLARLNCALRIVETENKPFLYRRLRQLNSRYNKSGDHPINFALVGGHGSPRTVQLGNSDTSGHLTADDISLLYEDMTIKTEDLVNGRGRIAARGKEKMREVKQYFRPSAEVAYISCSTADTETPNNIVQVTSKAMDNQTQGPKIPSHVKEIDVWGSGESGIKMSVQYYDEKGIYRSGQYVGNV